MPKPCNIHKEPVRQMQIAVRALNVCFRLFSMWHRQLSEREKGKTKSFSCKSTIASYDTCFESFESKASTNDMAKTARCSRGVDRADEDRKAKEARGLVKTPGTPFLSSTCMLFPFVADIISSSEQPIRFRFPSWPLQLQSAAFHLPWVGGNRRRPKFRPWSKPPVLVLKALHR